MNKNNNTFEITYAPEKRDGAWNSRGEHFLYSGCRILSSFGSKDSSNLDFCPRSLSRFEEIFLFQHYFRRINKMNSIISSFSSPPAKAGEDFSFRESAFDFFFCSLPSENTREAYGRVISRLASFLGDAGVGLELLLLSI